jgi:hypothetical protein
MIGHFIKLPQGVLAPSGEADKELLAKIKAGEIVKLTLSRVRNYKFHKKFFSLLNLAFDYWNPTGPPNKWNIEPEKNFDRFRKDVIVLAGYYDATHRLNGDVRIEAKSISFASMSEDEFEKLYSACVDVILKHVCVQYDGKMLDQVVDQIMAFT